MSEGNNNGPEIIRPRLDLRPSKRTLNNSDQTNIPTGNQDNSTDRPKLRLTPNRPPTFQPTPQEESTDTTHRPRLRLAPREKPFSQESEFTANAGGAFWNQISPEKQAVIEEPIRIIEDWLASHFEEGFVSPGVAKAETLRRAGGLEQQRDATSCTFVATGNDMRILDTQRPEYSSVALRAQVHQHLPIEESRITAQGLRVNDLRTITSSGTPYNQFEVTTVGWIRDREPGTSPEMLAVLNALGSGDVAVTSWRSTPGRAIAAGGSIGFLEHARSIVGFSKLPDNKIAIYIVDPYGRFEQWSFRDWVAAKKLNDILDNPHMDLEGIKKFAENTRLGGEMVNSIASAMVLLHKKNPI